MKTEYVVLWVDDELDAVEEDREFLVQFLEGFGITTILRAIESTGTGEIHAQVKEVVDDPDLDLIVVDYLMNGMDGKELIEQIRNSDHVFLPVVFYSSAGMGDLGRAVQEAQLDGVYLASRDGVRRKIQMVVRSLLRKEQTSKQTRGLLMEGVSEIDANLRRVLERIWDRLNGEQRTQLMTYFRKKVEDRAKSTAKALEEVPRDEGAFWSHVQARFVSGTYDTMMRWKIVKRGLALIGYEADRSAVFDELNIMTGGKEALVGLRNRYAHSTRAELDEGHSEELCIEIRRELRRQQQNVEYLAREI